METTLPKLAASLDDIVHEVKRLAHEANMDGRDDEAQNLTDALEHLKEACALL